MTFLELSSFLYLPQGKSFSQYPQSLSVDSIYYQIFGTPRLLAIFRQHIVSYSRVNGVDAVEKSRGGDKEKEKET